VEDAERGNLSPKDYRGNFLTAAIPRRPTPQIGNVALKKGGENGKKAGTESDYPYLSDRRINIPTVIATIAEYRKNSSPERKKRLPRPRGERGTCAYVEDCGNAVSIGGIAGTSALSFGRRTVNTSGRNFRPPLSRTAVRPPGTKELYKHEVLVYMLRRPGQMKARLQEADSSAFDRSELFTWKWRQSPALHKIMQVFIKANC